MTREEMSEIVCTGQKRFAEVLIQGKTNGKTPSELIEITGQYMAGLLVTCATEGCLPMLRLESAVITIIGLLTVISAMADTEERSQLADALSRSFAVCDGILAEKKGEVH